MTLATHARLAALILWVEARSSARTAAANESAMTAPPTEQQIATIYQRQGRLVCRRRRAP